MLQTLHIYFAPEQPCWGGAVNPTFSTLRFEMTMAKMMWKLNPGHLPFTIANHFPSCLHFPWRKSTWDLFPTMPCAHLIWELRKYSWSNYSIQAALLHTKMSNTYFLHINIFKYGTSSIITWEYGRSADSHTTTEGLSQKPMVRGMEAWFLQTLCDSHGCSSWRTLALGCLAALSVTFNTPRIIAIHQLNKLAQCAKHFALPIL